MILPSAQIRAPSGENIFIDFSSIWAIFYERENYKTRCIERKNVSSEISRNIFATRGKIWPEGRIIVLGKFIYKVDRVET